ncbi:hypothetical protein PPERSA_11567 [Pseudocohnilembus persalinus]|uniref:Fe2OG dioxygenase domain-containing protein n=1 Tax=Pseudocohnilembus persalinus TaxID=266149 RepID=A0A0V0Q9Q8_PSEPJ|nr:hypothetical protein PPERSA_11567 [Pseudocohnilembus persalinus]|eukprot:KRW98966.1 hypothetical protein PPERSA_11567 [Pseudocohnilembus persalinus]
MSKILYKFCEKNTTPLQIIDPLDLQAPYKIKNACINEGFFYLNHKNLIKNSLIQQVFQESKIFFSLPQKTKLKLKASQNNGMRGYIPFEAENLNPKQRKRGDTKESYHIGRHVPLNSYENQLFPMSKPNVFPDLNDKDFQSLQNFQKIMEEYHKQMQDIGHLTIKLIAKSINLPENFFDKYITRPLVTLRICHYSKEISDPNSEAMGCGEHTDYGIITLLKTDQVEGLQIYLNDKWIDVPYIEDAFIVNIGDLLQRWTNNKFKSTLHRVVNKTGQERYSLPYFYEPNFDSKIEVLEQFIDENNPCLFPPIISGEHLLDMYSKTY